MRQTPRLRRGLRATYDGGREGPRVISYKGHLGPIEDLLEENPVFKINGRLWVLMKSRIVVAGMVLRLGGWAADALTLTSPVLFRRNNIVDQYTDVVSEL